MPEELDTIRLDLPASHKYLTVLGTCIEEMLQKIDQIPDTTRLVYSVQLAIHEACTNIIDHAYTAQTPGRIAITLVIRASPRRFVAELKDTGKTFDPASIPDPNLLEGQERGYGLFLMREILDEIAYEALPDGNRWRLTKNL